MAAYIYICICWATTCQDVEIGFKSVLADAPSSPPAKLGNLGENPNKKCFGWFAGLAASGWEKILGLVGANAMILKHWFCKLFKEMPPSPSSFFKIKGGWGHFTEDIPKSNLGKTP